MVQPPTDIVDLYPIAGLTTRDRCDTCGAQAVWSAERDAALLLFCHHHKVAGYTRLTETGWVLIKDTIMWAHVFGP